MNQGIQIVGKPLDISRYDFSTVNTISIHCSYSTIETLD